MAFGRRVSQLDCESAVSAEESLTENFFLLSIVDAFSVSIIRYADKNNLREKRFILAHSSGLPSITAGKSRCPGLEAAAHITSITRKQRAVNVSSAQPLSSSYQSGIPAKGWCWSSHLSLRRFPAHIHTGSSSRDSRSFQPDN